MEENNIQIIQPTSNHELNKIRMLLLEYAEMRNFDIALGDYESELEELPGIYAKPKGCLLLAYLNDQPAGCVAFREFGDDVCEMKRLFVSVNFRGNNIGSSLVDRLITEARNAGYRQMLLDTHPWMDSAQSLYTGMGFVECDPYHYNPTSGIRFFRLELQ